MSFPVETPPGAVLTPLSASQEEALSAFYEALSPQTRRFYSVADGRSLAHAHCTTIAQYDKLRLVLQVAGRGTLLALVEFSFDLTAADLERFGGYGVELRPETASRWGLCVADAWQGRGVGRALAAPSIEIARRFGRTCMILLGGVHAANAKALGYYRRIGFTEAGRFTNDAGVGCVDMLLRVDGLQTG